jgi:hypothetical protein
MKTILIIDPDLGFVFWLGQTLASGGCCALPAKGIDDAILLLGQLSRGVDLLVVNPGLSGASAFLDSLRTSQPNLKVLAVLSSEEQRTDPLWNASAVVRKPLQLDKVSGALWLRMIEQILTSRLGAKLRGRP